MQTPLSTGRVLIVDDDEQSLHAVRALLVACGFEVICVSSGAAAMQLLEQGEAELDCVLTDLYMADVSGMDLLMHVRQASPELPVIVVTGDGEVPAAVTAMREGAFDFQLKPLSSETLTLALGRAIAHRRLKHRNRYLEQRLEVSQRFGGMIGNSKAMRHVFELVASVSATDAAVLVTGESGTGKELLARSLHEHGRRAMGPLVVVSCASLSEALLESELFGQEGGAFSGARGRRRSAFEEASGGTLLLDDVGALPACLQVRLLRVMEERNLRPVANHARPIDVRVIATTSRPLDEEVRKRRFREDLYYRLSVVGIELPPLRERGEDVLLLAHHLLAKHASRLGKPAPRLGSCALEAIASYDFPGNIRELENAIERAVVMTHDEVLLASALPPQLCRRSNSSRPRLRAVVDVGFTEARSRFERNYLEQVLEDCSGNLSQSARRAGMDRSNFRRLLDRHGIRPSPGAAPSAGALDPAVPAPLVAQR